MARCSARRSERRARPWWLAALAVSAAAACTYPYDALRCRGDACAPADAAGDAPAECPSDAGVRSETVVIARAALEAMAPGCLASPNGCARAAHELCRARCAATGYGPVELTAQDARFACVGAATLRATTLAELQAQIPECDGRFTRACLAAINRLCETSGFESGFGPIPAGDDAGPSSVACLDPTWAARIGTTYAELTRVHDLCTETPDAPGSVVECRVAAHRFCARSDAGVFATGFGPVEREPSGTARVICVRARP